MLQLAPKLIERYCRDHTAPETDLLKELVRETYAKTSIPQMQVGHMEGTFLRLLVRLVRARRVLEIGTFTGYSALCMAEALPATSQVITLDIDPASTEIARRYWSRNPHGRKIKLRLGPALETLKTLRGSFDLVFIDADKESYPVYWEACLPKLRPGGLIVADNTLWGGDVLNPRDVDSKAIAAFNERVRLDRRVEAILLPIRDGITLAYKFPAPRRASQNIPF